MPRILITTQVYPPESHPSAIMVRELATHLAASGWEVDVVCGHPHHPTGLLPPGWKKKLWEAKHQCGFRVLRTWHFTSPSRSILARAGVYLSLALGTAMGALLARKTDLMLVYGPPLVGGALGAVVAHRHHAKLVNVVYDIYPDIAVETGKVSNPLVIGAAKLAERFQYWAAERTVVLSDGFKRQIVDKGVAEEKVAVIPVWLDPDEIRPMDRDNAWRREQGIPLDKFVVLYAGTIGIISGATMVADAAHLLRVHDEILFLFVGEGEQTAALEARVKELGLTNMKFLPFQPRERLSEMQATADVGLVTLVPGRGRTSVPSKVQGYMAAGRPVIASVDRDSDTAREISEYDAGFLCAPGDPGALAETILIAASDRARCSQKGKNGKNRLNEYYSKAGNLELFERTLRGVLSRAAPQKKTT